MNKRTLSEIVNKVQQNLESATELEKAIVAAYWAGQDEGWRACSNSVRNAMQKKGTHKTFRHLTGEYIALAESATAKADSSEEILGWDFSV